MKRNLILSVACALFFLPMKAQQCEVNFDLNYDTTQKIEGISVKQGCAIPMDKKPLPQREGYRFGGWYTSQEGQAQDEWLFGKMVGMMGAFSAQANDSMKVEKPMTLYAKWIAPTHIVDAEGLNRMRDDLHGWYVLDCDIDLSGMDDWEQVGEYEVHYEWAEAEWWRNAFKGKLDGQGHTISGFTMRYNGNYAGLFGIVSGGATFRNFVLDNTCSILGGAFVGIIGGSNGRGTVTMECLGNEGSVTAVNQNAGGIFGCNMGGAATPIFRNCYVTGPVKGGRESGQITGYAGNGQAYNCYAIGTIEGVYKADMSDAMLRGNPRSNNCYSIYPDRNATVVDESQITGGELCYLLNEGNSQQEPVWFQTLGKDGYPVLNSSHAQVLLADDGTFFNEDVDGLIAMKPKSWNTSSAVYDLSGRRISAAATPNSQLSTVNLKKGLHIIRTTDGKTYKVLVK